MSAGSAVQRPQANHKNHPKIRDRVPAIDHAARVIYRVCCLAGSTDLIDNIRADLDADGVRAAMKKRDTAAVFDWLIAALSYQGISDRLRLHGATWVCAMARYQPQTCPRCLLP
jgi:hypothetical protein